MNEATLNAVVSWLTENVDWLAMPTQRVSLGSVDSICISRQECQWTQQEMFLGTIG